MGRILLSTFTGGALLFATCASASSFDPKPWLADLEQARQAFHLKYANWSWVETEREVKIDRLFDEFADRLRKAADEGQARAVFDRIASKLADGHVDFDWPAPSPPIGGAAPEPPDLCDSIGYNSRQNAPGVGQSLPGYQPLPASTDVLAAGIVISGGHTVGVLRIGVFQPEGFPDLCRAASRGLRIPEQPKCDDACRERISGWAYDHLALILEERLRQLKVARAETLLVDITHNARIRMGGGSRAGADAEAALSERLALFEASTGPHTGGRSRRTFARMPPPHLLLIANSYLNWRLKPMLRSPRRTRPARPTRAIASAKPASRPGWSAHLALALFPARSRPRMSSPVAISLP